MDGASLETRESAGVNSVTRRVNVNAGNIEDVWRCQITAGLVAHKHVQPKLVSK